MCGRFALTVPAEAVADLFGARPWDDYAPRPPRYNICPTQEIDAVLLDEEGGRRLRRVRWGLLPHWVRKPGEGPLLINARAETIAEKPAFRSSVQNRRCLIPVSGFYEWRAEGGVKQPYYIRPRDGGVAAFAGVWRDWRDPEGETVATAAIVTCGANEALQAVHSRMPVVIEPEDYGLWLGEEGKGAAVLMRPAREDLFAFHPVSRDVNSGRTDEARLIEPVEA